MFRNHHNARAGISVVSVLRTLVCVALFAATQAFAVDSGDIVVAAVRGEVHVTMNGAARGVRAGTVLELPASVRTGRDGHIELRQGATSVKVAPDTLLDFPALERRGAPVDRIVQPRGNAFYDIGKREGRKLRVETPYLVGVIKGTQFNVAAADEGTTISLFEGRLEVAAADGSSTVDLTAGEIASRKRGDAGINVLKMEATRSPAASSRQPAPGPGARDVVGDASGAPSTGDRGTGGRGPGGEPGRFPVVSSVVAPPGLDEAVRPDVRTPVTAVQAEGQASLGVNGVNVDAVASVNAPAVDGSSGVSVSVGNDASAGVASDARVDAGPATVDTSSSVSVDTGSGAASVAVDTATTVQSPAVSVDVGAATTVDAGVTGVAVDVATETRVDAGPVDVAVDTTTSVDVSPGSGAVDVSADTNVDTGVISTDVDTNTSVDLGSGEVSAAVEAPTAVAGVDAPVAVETAVDVSTGSVDLGVSVAGADLGLGLDLGLGDSDPVTDTDGSTTTPTDTGTTDATDVGGLLDGLVRRPGQR
jgi:hypothetical protein